MQSVCDLFHCAFAYESMLCLTYCIWENGLPVLPSSGRPCSILTHRWRKTLPDVSPSFPCIMKKPLRYGHRAAAANGLSHSRHEIQYSTTVPTKPNYMLMKPLKSFAPRECRFVIRRRTVSIGWRIAIRTGSFDPNSSRSRRRFRSSGTSSKIMLFFITGRIGSGTGRGAILTVIIAYYPRQAMGIDGISWSNRRQELERPVYEFQRTGDFQERSDHFSADAPWHAYRGHDLSYRMQIRTGKPNTFRSWWCRLKLPETLCVKNQQLRWAKVRFRRHQIIPLFKEKNAFFQGSSGNTPSYHFYF